MRSGLSISLPSGQLAFPGSLVSPGLMAMADAAGAAHSAARALPGLAHTSAGPVTTTCFPVCH